MVECMTTKQDLHPGVIETRTVHDVHRAATSLLVETAAHGPVDELTEFGRFVIGMLLHHHQSEDTDLWPLLIDAAPDLSAAPDGLTREHHLLDGALDALERSEIGEVGDRDRLRGAAIALRDLVHEHLSHEEPILFPALTEHVSEHAWDQFSQRTVATSPPEGNHLMVALLDEVGSPEQVELVLRHVPPAHREHLPAMRAQARRTLAALPTRTRRRPTSARSNRRHVVPLLYHVDGERLVVFGSNGGAPTHPAWFHNAVSHPDVSAELGGEARQYRARPAHHDERERLWSAVTTRFPPYAQYEAMTDRDIPVLILEPRAPTAP